MSPNKRTKRNFWSLEVKFNKDCLKLLLALVLLPNFLSILFIPLPLGLKFYFFQVVIIASALSFGPLGGLLSGALGSIYLIFAESNWYILLYTLWLGFLVGTFYRLKLNLLISVFLGSLFSSLILFMANYYLFKEAISLFLSNLIWLILLNSYFEDFKKKFCHFR